MLLNRSTGWIGVDIGTRSVKVAQVVRRHGRFELADATVVQRVEPWQAPDWSQFAPMSSSDEISAGMSLGDAFAGRLAACSCPMSLCELHSFRTAERDELRQRAGIARELATVAAGSGSVEFDFWSVDHVTDSASSSGDNVLVLSISSDWADRLAQDLSDAGLQCQVLDGVPLTLARAVEMDAQTASPQTPLAAIDWGFSRATLSVVMDRRALFVRCLRNCGFDRMLQSLMQTLAVSLEEAETLLAEHGIQTPPATEIDVLIEEVISQPLHDFVSELNRTLSYLRSHRSNVAPRELCLFGGGASIRNIDSYLAAKLNLPARCWAMQRVGKTASQLPKTSLRVLGPAIALSSLAWDT